MWYCEKGNYQDYSNHADVQHNCKCNDAHEKVVDKINRSPVGARIVLIEGNVQDKPEKQQEEKYYEQTQCSHKPDIKPGDSEDAAKKKHHQVGCIAGCDEDKYYTDSHAQRPEDADCRILPDISFFRNIFNAQCRKNAENRCSENWANTKVIADTYATE